MTVQTAMYDVFLSCSFAEAEPGAMVERALRNAGLSVFNAATALTPGESIGDVLRRAMAESQVVVAVIDPRHVTSANMGVELGAALAWNKPIYVVNTGPAGSRLPGYLQNLSDSSVYPVSRIDDLAHSVKQSEKSLSEEDRALLARLYAELGTPVDKLVMDPAAMEDLAQRFNARGGTHVPVRQLARELFFLRMKGLLRRRRA
ncbi:MAG: toll/interleukin-1 receptor domain-containing protein [Pirellulales bacterium]|nr:toll/interleukin-1 receptor domain-containing protein [Pirellulales bacterium]